MAPALTHFCVGAAFALLLATPVVWRRPLPAWSLLWLVILGGCWGLGPDLHHVVPGPTATLQALHRSPRVDVFAGHYTLDRPAVRARPTASIAAALLWFGVAVTAVTAAAWRRARTAGARSTAPSV